MRLLWKLSLGFGSLMVLTTAGVGLLVAERVENASREETELGLRSEAALLRDLVQASPALRGRGADPALQEHVARLGRELGVRFTVLARDGAVVADTQRDPAELENHLGRPEIQAARATGLGTSTRESASVHDRLLYLAVPILDPASGREPIGYARVSLPLSEVDRRVHMVRGAALAATGLGLLATLLATFLMARYVTRPLTTVTEGALEIAAGRPAPHLGVDSADELGALARAFNAMSEELRGRLETITTDRNKFQAILASMVEGVVAVDRAGRVVHLNEVAGRLLGVNPFGSIGRPLHEVARRPEMEAALRRTLDDAQPSTAEVSQGVEQAVRLHSTPLRTGDGQVTGALLVIHDVSELRRLERVRRDFVANVSHELKTPLTAIQCLVENLLDDQEMPTPQRQRFLEKVDNQTRRLTSLVKDLLVLSRVESEESALVSVPMDLRLPIEDSVAALQGTAEEKRITLKKELPAQPVTIRGDREGLRQVVDNLLGNALTYTPAGGRVVVRLRLEAPAAGAAPQALLEVADTGIGIEAEHQERIFERFYRVDKGRSREMGGTGLGLSIVKHVTIAHQGEVSLQSEPGRGSTFRVALPLYTGEGPGDTSRSTRGSDSSAGDPAPGPSPSTSNAAA